MGLARVRRLLRLYRRALASAAYAKSRGASGMDFDDYGRSLGWRLRLRGSRTGIDYIFNPVSSTRYFEFPFALDCLPDRLERVLDVSSPRLFSLYVAERYPQSRIRVINPDQNDANVTSEIVAKLGIPNLQVDVSDVSVLDSMDTKFDCIWSISVVEHISGSYDDRDAVRWMYDALAPGGRLLLTVPTDTHHWDEYRDTDTYELGAEATKGSQYFFQRSYDIESIRERLLVPVGVAEADTLMRWYGEKTPGLFHEYVESWLKSGKECTVDDPRIMSDGFTEYESWEEMPGVGVCALMITKPA